VIDKRGNIIAAYYDSDTCYTAFWEGLNTYGTNSIYKISKLYQSGGLCKLTSLFYEYDTDLLFLGGNTYLQSNHKTNLLLAIMDVSTLTT
jgi:hypothetical protein